MALYLEIESKDLGRLVSAIKYVISRKGYVIDVPMVEFLSSELEDIESHLQNEKEGGGEEVFAEIDVVMNFIHGESHGRKKVT